MTILGTIASSYVQATGSYFSIASATDTGAGGGIITFNSIPDTYQHLEIRLLGKSDNTTYDSIYTTARFNSDSTASYNCQGIYANTPTNNVLAMYNGTYTDQFICNEIVASKSGIASQTSSPSIIRIMDYKDTSKFKSVLTVGGWNKNGSPGVVDVRTGLWRSTSAITRVDLYAGYKNYTVAALYGIKG